MKRLFLLLAVALGAVGCSLFDPYEKKSPAPERNGYGEPLYGDVEEVTEVYYLFDFDADDWVIEEVVVYTFNYAGDVVVKDFYSSEGFKQRREYSYNSAGGVTSWAYYDAKGTITSFAMIEYDQYDNKIKQVNYNGDGSIKEWFAYRYNKAGYMVEEDHYLEEDQLYEKYRYEYDENGNMLVEAHLCPDGTLYGQRLHKYDSDGNEVKKGVYYSNGQMDNEQRYEYNSVGDIIEEKRYNAYQLSARVTMEYDDKGNLVEVCEYRPDDSLKAMGNYKYDKRGSKIESVVYREVASEMVPHTRTTFDIVYRE